MQEAETMAVARHLQSIGVDVVRDGFASWVRDDLGFKASDESVDRALERVQHMVAAGHSTSEHDLVYHIAAAMPVHAQLDPFGGSAWRID